MLIRSLLRSPLRTVFGCNPTLFGSGLPPAAGLSSTAGALRCASTSPAAYTPSLIDRYVASTSSVGAASARPASPDGASHTGRPPLLCRHPREPAVGHFGVLVRPRPRRHVLLYHRPHLQRHDAGGAVPDLGIVPLRGGGGRAGGGEPGRQGRQGERGTSGAGLQLCLGMPCACVLNTQNPAIRRQGGPPRRCPHPLRTQPPAARGPAPCRCPHPAATLCLLTCTTGMTGRELPARKTSTLALASSGVMCRCSTRSTPSRPSAIAWGRGRQGGREGGREREAEAKGRWR